MSDKEKLLKFVANLTTEEVEYLAGLVDEIVAFMAATEEIKGGS